jgi:hypothetical protein
VGFEGSDFKGNMILEVMVLVLESSREIGFPLEEVIVFKEEDCGATKTVKSSWQHGDEGT